MIIKEFPAYSKKKVKSYLPPEGYFESREALFVLINAQAKSRGYEFTTQRSIREKNDFLTISMHVIELPIR